MSVRRALTQRLPGTSRKNSPRSLAQALVDTGFAEQARKPPTPAQATQNASSTAASKSKKRKRRKNASVSCSSDDACETPNAPRARLQSTGSTNVGEAARAQLNSCATQPRPTELEAARALKKVCAAFCVSVIGFGNKCATCGGCSSRISLVLRGLAQGEFHPLGPYLFIEAGHCRTPTLKHTSSNDVATKLTRVKSRAAPSWLRTLRRKGVSRSASGNGIHRRTQSLTLPKSSHPNVHSPRKQRTSKSIAPTTTAPMTTTPTNTRRVSSLAGTNPSSPTIQHTTQHRPQQEVDNPKREFVDNLFEHLQGRRFAKARMRRIRQLQRIAQSRR